MLKNMGHIVRWWNSDEKLCIEENSADVNLKRKRDTSESNDFQYANVSKRMKMEYTEKIDHENKSTSNSANTRSIYSMPEEKVFTSTNITKTDAILSKCQPETPPKTLCQSKDDGGMKATKSPKIEDPTTQILWTPGKLTSQDNLPQREIPQSIKIENTPTDKCIISSSKFGTDSVCTSSVQETKISDSPENSKKKIAQTTNLSRSNDKIAGNILENLTLPVSGPKIMPVNAASSKSDMKMFQNYSSIYTPSLSHIPPNTYQTHFICQGSYGHPFPGIHPSFIPRMEMGPLAHLIEPSAIAPLVMENKTPKQEKRHSCDTCGSRYSNKGQLKAHLRSHTGERPFKCDYENCNKDFTRNEELTRHKRIHTGERPFHCEICKKSFGRRDHLKKHKKRHTIEHLLPPHPVFRYHMPVGPYAHLGGLL